MTKMNPEVKDKWIKALRSGEYNQTTGKLKNNIGFCCLGVLCDLHSKETGNEWGTSESSDTIDEFFYFDEYSVLPKEVMDWSGIKFDEIVNEIGSPDLGDFSLTDLNDSGNYDFNKIADVIEEHF